ncbi:MAG: hypothetical protein K0S39_336 [Paenibacillus sp.]|nr:hypothetical protein [Paenibacillus sp.]
MPVFTNGKEAPAWCEMRHFEIVKLAKGERHTFDRVGKKEKLIIGEGRCLISFGEQQIEAEERANLDLSGPDEAFRIDEVLSDTVLIRMCGDWGGETGGSGLFRVTKAESVVERGDPTHYRKETNIDNHYHDCDEYWIIFEGKGVAVSEGSSYEVGPGDCVATGMGHHHDFPLVSEPVKAVYFETTLQGNKRRGHLWNHTHGAAEPIKERV